MIRLIILVFTLAFTVSCDSNEAINNGKESSQIKEEKKPGLILNEGFWVGNLRVDSLKKIPFTFEVIEDSIFFINADERLGAVISKINDSIQVKMPIFDSEFQLVLVNDKEIKGKWLNKAKGDYSMDFTAKYTENKVGRFEKESLQKSIDGKWETTFSQAEEDEYKAVGLFEGRAAGVYGSFLTETGDYRFLEGCVANDSLFLSCFDGAHAFLFEAKIIGDSLKGVFYSGNHYKDDWSAFRNESFELSNPDFLTRENIGVDLAFEFPSLSDSSIVYPSKKYEGKVVVIQVMGSWCPNCMDETQFFTDLYNFYNEKGLEVIALAFEKPEDLESKKERVVELQKYFNAKYDFAIAGNASKTEAQRVLPALDKVLSFPTAIFIDRKGKIRKIHTGFYGPGTGTYYLNYIKSTKGFVETLLNE